MVKMCPDYKLHLEGPGKCRGGKGKCECPKNTDVFCQIIPRREKMVRFKAWATMGYGKPWEITCNPHMPKDTFKPCFVLIAAKYLKEAK